MRFSVKKPRNTDMALQITSMADCFIIILVFLLKSVATGALNISPSQGLKLPQAMTNGLAEQALTVEISETAIQVENKVVTPLSRFRFAQKGNSRVPQSLDKALSDEKKRQELIAKSNADVRLNQKILIVSDQRTPYSTLKSVLEAAATHGFSDFKLVVAKKE